MILGIRTDTMDATLVLLDGVNVIAKKTWPAGRQLSQQLLPEIKKLISDDWPKLSGVIVLLGPGSFTGLRIGATVGNAIAYGNKLPIVGAAGDKWIDQGVARLAEGENDKQVLPQYGAEPNISRPKH